MMMDRLDELTERLSVMQGSAGAVSHRGQTHDPKLTLNTGQAHHTAMTPVNLNTHLLMNNMRVRGHRRGLRVLKGQENRVHRTVTRQHAAQSVANKTGKHGKHKAVTQKTKTQTVTPKHEKQDTERGRAYVHGNDVHTKKKLKTPRCDEYMKTRQVKADMPVRQGQARMILGP